MSSGGRKVQLAPGFSAVEFVTCLWIVCAILTLVVSDTSFFTNRYGKRQEPQSGSFFISGSRYGRSGGQEKNIKSLTKVEVLPRVDRFYPGGRYGKRIPSHYKRASAVSRLDAVLDYMDRENELDIERENPERKNDEDNLEILS